MMEKIKERAKETLLGFWHDGAMDGNAVEKIAAFGEECAKEALDNVECPSCGCTGRGQALGIFKNLTGLVGFLKAWKSHLEAAEAKLAAMTKERDYWKIAADTHAGWAKVVKDLKEKLSLYETPPNDEAEREAIEHLRKLTIHKSREAVEALVRMARQRDARIAELERRQASEVELWSAMLDSRKENP